jgi:glycosyltransferase involved in cell wall biosynthesis
MKRVAVIITLAEHGGAQRHVYDVVTSMLERYEFRVFVGQDGWLIDRLRAVGVQCEVIPTLGREIGVAKDVSALFDTYRALKDFQPDLVHLHSSKAALLGRLASCVGGYPVVYTVHGWGFKPGVPVVRRVVVWLIESLLGLFAKRIVCVSKYDYRLAAAWLPHVRHRLRTVWNGVVDDSHRADYVAKDIVRILMVARFQEPKLQSLVVDAARLAARGCRLEVQFVGDGPQRDEVEALAVCESRNCEFKFLGSRDDVPQLLASADVFLLLSGYEGLPLSIIEAMRAGLPVIASSVGGVPELIENNVTGLLVENKSEYIAAAIAELANNVELRRAMGLAGRAKYERSFASNAMVESLTAVYGECVKQPQA